jgi:hypothetical protein
VAAESYLPLLILGVAGVVIGGRRWAQARRRDPAPLVRLRDPGAASEASTRAAIHLLMSAGALAVLVVLAAPVIGALASPLCEATNGAVGCRDGGALSPLPLAPALLVAVPLLLLAWRELRDL